MTLPLKTTSSHIKHFRWWFSAPVDLALLSAITIAGAYLRSFGIDHGNTYHPDERHMIMVTEQLEANQMNPNSFAYGSFSFYALWIFARLCWFVWNVTGQSHGLFAGMPDPTHYDGLLQVGRILCLLLGVIAIPLSYGLAVKLYRCSLVGLIAGALLSFNVFHIQLSRFFTSDITLTTLSLASILALVTVFQSGSLLAYLTLGVTLGLATATKISSVFLATPLVATVLLTLARDFGWARGIFRLLLALIVTVMCTLLAAWVYRSQFANSPIFYGSYLIAPGGAMILAVGPLLLLTSLPLRALSIHLGRTALALSIAACVFVIAEPFAVLDYPTFIRHTTEQTSMVQGLWRPPYTIQYENTTPYLYHLKQMLWFTMGLPVFLLVALGCVVVLIRSTLRLGAAIFDRSQVNDLEVGEVIPVIFAIVFFAATAGFQVKFPRYLMPLYPILFLFAASLASLGTTQRRGSSPCG